MMCTFYGEYRIEHDIIHFFLLLLFKELQNLKKILIFISLTYIKASHRKSFLIYSIRVKCFYLHLMVAFQVCDFTFNVLCILQDISQQNYYTKLPLIIVYSI